jgi:hypothetical protein
MHGVLVIVPVLTVYFKSHPANPSTNALDFLERPGANVNVMNDLSVSPEQALQEEQPRREP